MFDGHGRSPYNDGFNNDCGGIGMQDGDHRKQNPLVSVVKGNSSANMTASCMAGIRTIVSHYDPNRPENLQIRMGISGEVFVGRASANTGSAYS